MFVATVNRVCPIMNAVRRLTTSSSDQPLIARKILSPGIVATRSLSFCVERVSEQADCACYFVLQDAVRFFI